jgi:predicted DNA-binding ArsR family transcriptional regulator
MDFINCSAKNPSKSCCGCETELDSELEDYDHIYASVIETGSKVTKNIEDFINIEPKTIISINKR